MAAHMSVGNRLLGRPGDPKNGHTARYEARFQEEPAPQDAALGQDAAAGRAVPPAPTANTEICWSKFSPLHNGHFGCEAPYTKASKRFLQSLQTYSKIGMHTLR